MKFSRSLFICIILLANISIFAQNERDKGIEHYNKQNYQSAITLLNSVTKLDKKDAEAWNYLGMAYLNISKFKESRKALENAVKQNPQNATFPINLAYAHFVANKLSDAEKAIQKAIALDSKNATAFYIRGLIFLRKGKYDNAIDDANLSLNIDKSFGVSYLLKSNTYLYKFGQEVSKGKKFSESIGLLKDSIESLETCLVNCPKDAVLTANQAKLEELKVFYKYFATRKDESFSSIPSPKNSKSAPVPIPPADPSITPLNITAKPRANYTDSARQAGVQGTITLAVLFSADGNKKMIIAIKPLSNGLTEEAIKAAQQIGFTPQMKDGKPVSVVKMVQYNFTLY